MPPKFDKNSQRYAVVHRPHDDPHFHDAGASEHVLVPIKNPNAREKAPQGPQVRTYNTPKVDISKDDAPYDYSQHLRPMGQNPDAVFIDAKPKTKPKAKNNIDDMFKTPINEMIVEPGYRDPSAQPVQRVFQGGVAKPEYLAHQQDTPDDIQGFKPEMDPALREVLEALEDEAYVVNEDVAVEPVAKAKKAATHDDDDDDILAELLAGGEANGEDGDEGEDWDNMAFEDYEDEHYIDEMAQFDNIDSLQDLQDIDYQADVRRFQQEKRADSSDNEFDSEEAGEEEEEEDDVLGDLPSFSGAKGKGNGNKKSRSRRKKGAMSDVSGFSMTSSAVARTETMTVLDDQYDNIINGYENYEEEEAEQEQEYKPFDMASERSDFESLVDDFLDNYELESGGRKLVKKNEEVQKFKDAADAVSKGKLSQRRNRERQKKGDADVAGAAKSLSSLRF